MFTIEQIKAAHSKVKSGADFPRYVQDMKQLGIISYEHFVSDGHITYHGKNGEVLHADPKWEKRAIAEKGLPQNLINSLKSHQEGGSTYFEFCQQITAFGVNQWIVDMQKMTCTYYDTEGNNMLLETIPVP